MTKTVSFPNIQKRIAVFVVAVAILFGMSPFTPKVQAESSQEAMLAQIAQLLELVAALQTQLTQMNSSSSGGTSSEGGFTDRAISIGDRIQTTNILKVRAGAGITENWVNNVSAYTAGTVVNGPQYANGYTWWHVTYDSGTSGWSAENWFKKINEVKITLSGVDMTVKPSNQSQTEYVAEFDFGNKTAYTYEIDWGEGDGSLQTKRSRIVTICNSDWTCSGPGGQLHDYEKSGSYMVKLFALVPTSNGSSVRKLVTSKTIIVSNPSVSTDVDLSYDLEIKNPNSRSEYAPGDLIRLLWDEENLEGEKGIVTLEGNNKQIHIGEHIDIGDEGDTVRIPYDISPGEYDLKLWVSYIKDGDPKGVSDLVRIIIESEDEEEEDEDDEAAVSDWLAYSFSIGGTKSAGCNGDTYVGYSTKYNVWVGAQLCGSNDKYKLYMSSSKSGTYYQIADYAGHGQDHCELINDDYTIPNEDSINSGTCKDCAVGSLNDPDGELVYARSNFGEQFEKVTSSYWGDLSTDYYQCSVEIGTSIVHEEVSSFWDIDRNEDAVYVVGVYEGSYPDGDSHSFRYHPQGEVVLNMTKQAGQMTDTMLVLTSYEPVEWQLEGDATEYVTRVFLSGYYDQEITGIGSDVEVVHMSHESNDDEYYYFHEKDSVKADSLIDYIESQSGYTAYPYYGSYSAAEINLGLKG